VDEVIGWLLAGVFAVATVYFAFRRPRPPDQGRIKSSETSDSRAGEPAETEEDSSERALQGMSRYLKTAVLEPLESGLQTGDLRPPVEDAVDAVRDLAFYARIAPENATGNEDLVMQVRAVTREYTSATGTPVKFSAPDRPVRTILAVEGFKDALFLLLENAGRFAEGRAVDGPAQGI